jgi:HTH-type transcriptional regulator/antitoxin HipB
MSSRSSGSAESSAPPSLVHLVARRIAAARRAKGLTQEALAAQLGLATRNLQRLESGKQNLTLGTVERVARAIGVPALELLPRLSDDDGLLVAADHGGRPNVVPVVPLSRVSLAFAAPERCANAWMLVRGEVPAASVVVHADDDTLAPLAPRGSYALLAPPPERLVPGVVVLWALAGNRRLLSLLAGLELLVTGDSVAVLEDRSTRGRMLRIPLGGPASPKPIAVWLRRLREWD